MSTESIQVTGTRLSLRDHIGTIAMRLGLGRTRYRIAPGLYKIGNPGESSPVFVSANYKMSFDVLRKELAFMDAWILVLNTRGVNVWCAAGKGTFSTSEITRMAKYTDLDKIVSHRELILPQLSAPGVSAHEVANATGFRVKFGPVRARDIPRFMEAGRKADASMRMVTFGLWERFVLTPVEFRSRISTSLYIMIAIFAISSIGSDFFSFHGTLERAFGGVTAYFIGLFSGSVVTPLLLPWIPARSFSVKGAAIGLLLSLTFCLFHHNAIGIVGAVAIILFSTSVSSYTALTFTGATPFTSPTGVEKEMRRAIPLQIATVIISIALWVVNSFKMGGI